MHLQQNNTQLSRYTSARSFVHFVDSTRACPPEGHWEDVSEAGACAAQSKSKGFYFYLAIHLFTGIFSCLSPPKKQEHFINLCYRPIRNYGHNKCRNHVLSFFGSTNKVFVDPSIFGIYQKSIAGTT
jgi:hypothetical protein